MSIASLQCPQPIRRRLTVAPRDYARRDRAIESFEAGDFLTAVRETLGYLLPGSETPVFAAGALCFVQGSARVRVHLDGDELALTTALMSLTPEAQSTAALRYVLTRLSATGQLFQPRLRGDTITLEFRERLSLLHPSKLAEVVQRMAVESENNDGWLQQRFGVGAPDREPIAPLDDA